MSRKIPKTKRNISMDTPLFNELLKRAEEENRSLSNLIETLVLKAIEAEKK